MEYLMKKLSWAINAESGEIYPCVWDKYNQNLKILNYPELYSEITLSMKNDSYDCVTKTLAPYLHVDDVDNVAFVRLFNMIEMLEVENKKVERVLNKFVKNYDTATIKDFEIDMLNAIFAKKIKKLCERKNVKIDELKNSEELLNA